MRFLLLCLLTGWPLLAAAAPPDWRVNASDFEHNMSLIARIEVDGAALLGDGDLLAAFADGELRGVATPTDYQGGHLFFLAAYSNETSGTLTFKAYDATNDRVVDLVQTTAFAPNAVRGTVSEPLVLSASSTGANAPPAFTSAPVTAARVGQAYAYAITTSDADGDPVQLSAPTLPAWLQLNGATLTGTPSTGHTGSHDVVLTASDGKVSTAQTFSVLVSADGNGTPRLEAFVADVKYADGSTVSVGRADVGASRTLSVRLANTGEAPLALSAASAEGDFRVTQQPATSIAPGASTSLVVTFTPSTAGVRQGTLTLTSNEADPTFTLTLSGEGTASANACEGTCIGLDPVLTLEGVQPGTAQTATFLVRNTGDTYLSGTVYATGAITAPFAVQSGLGAFFLGPGQTQDVVIQVNLATAGRYEMDLMVQHTATNRSNPERVTIIVDSDVAVGLEDQPATPTTLRLRHAPNPVRGQATVTYELAAPTPVRLAVYDLTGRQVAVLTEGARAAGLHHAAFDAAGLPSGVYLCRLEANGRSTTRRLTVLR